jgi:HD-like signal output (HDOD) protein
MISETEFIQELQTAIDENRITLPTLPEVALKVKDAVEQENSTASAIAEMVATDAALSARLLQVANSPLYRGRVPIESIQMAVTRLGLKLVRSLVVSLAMKQIFQATTDALDKRLRSVWEQSVEIAAISRALSQSQPHLEKEQAMLAGLVHNIGSLPILTMAETIPGLIENETRLDYFLEKFTPVIGKQILESWGFPESIVRVAENHRNLTYDGGPQATYADLVIVSRLQTVGDTLDLTEEEWLNIPAFDKVGLSPEVEVVNIEGVAEDMESVQEFFL